jgi:hypothetical protein
MFDHLPSKLKVLSSVPSTDKAKQNKDTEARPHSRGSEEGLRQTLGFFFFQRKQRLGTLRRSDVKCPHYERHFRKT